MSRTKIQFWATEELAQGVQELHPDNASAVYRALLAIGWLTAGLPRAVVEREIGQALRDGVPETLRKRLYALLASKDDQVEASANTQQTPANVEQTPVAVQPTMPLVQERPPLAVKEPEPPPPAPVPRSPLAGVGMDADWDDE